MLDASMAFFFPDGFMAKALLDDPRAGERNVISRTYRVSTTADGHLIYFAATEKELFGLFRALGHPEWIEDERYATLHARRRNQQELGAAIAGAFETWRTRDLVDRLAAEQVPFGPVLDLDEVPLDPQVVHNDLLRVREHPMLGRVLEARQPVRFSRTVTESVPLAPSQGADDEIILRELGRSDGEIAGLRAAGVIAR